MIRITTKGNLCILFLILIFIASCSKGSEETKNIVIKDDIRYIDGPYVFYENDKIRIINVNQHDEIIETIVDKVDSLLVQVPYQIPDHFYVKLNKNIQQTHSVYETQEKIFVVSDIEGNYYSFVNLLIGNEITDENLNWKYGSGHLVFNGDFVDRGRYVTQVLWLMYKLEQEAAAAGGQVHFILGNHEAMNLEGNFKYVVDKYKRLADDLGILYEDFYNEDNEMGRWMRSKNIIEKIGNNLFTHGGISKTSLEKKINLDEINAIAQANYGLDLPNNISTVPNLIFGRFGPLWYRGLVEDDSYYSKAKEIDVNKMLEYYDSDRIIIGHCIVDDISTDYNGKVVRIDQVHPENSHSDINSKALLIENGLLFKVIQTGVKTRL